MMFLETLGGIAFFCELICICSETFEVQFYVNFNCVT